jgi:hypothetical protein
MQPCLAGRRGLGLGGEAGRNEARKGTQHERGDRGCQPAEQGVVLGRAMGIARPATAERAAHTPNSSNTRPTISLNSAFTPLVQKKSVRLDRLG